MNTTFHNQFLDILTYIGTHVDKNILITCASILIFKERSTYIISDTTPSTDFKEIHGDLFTTSDKMSSLAHCVAKDLRMGKGIATFFKKKYGGIDELRSQYLEIGSVGVLERDNKYVYYLITKFRSNGLPTLSDLKTSLIQMKNHAVKNGVKMISMPRIGSGLDRLNWDQVKDTIIKIFDGTGIKIRVYYL
jgi:O-acetyl-ADP-ribose deacetylase (regulator of RNase III)